MAGTSIGPRYLGSHPLLLLLLECLRVKARELRGDEHWQATGVGVQVASGGVAVAL